MIERYEIKKENNEEVLYIEINFNYEFSKISLFKDIEKVLNKNKIKFSGKKIVITVSGIALATLLLTKPIIDNNNIKNSDYKYVSNIILNDYNDNNKIISSTEYETNKNSTEKNQIKTPIEENKDVNNNKINFNTNSNTNSNNKTTTNKKQTNTKTNNKTATNKTESKNKKDIKEEKTYVEVYRSNGEVLKIELEEYVIGVVAGEMPASFNIEALKAQSILARTYALKSISNNKKLTDTTTTQVYKDNNQLKALWKNDYNTYYNKIKKAVNETKGLVITYNGKYIEAMYHSTSNGCTEDSANVWGNSYPYLTTVESPYDKNVSSYKRTVNFSYDDLSKKLKININKDSIIEYKRNDSNRVNYISIDGTVFKGTEFRTKLGLRSTDFALSLDENNVSITTYGFGHGVGMSQYGANEMAKNGKNYKEIINHYYNGVEIEKK